MEYLREIVIGFTGSLIAYEVTQHYRRWCTAIIRFAAKRLPDDQRAIREEEWLGHLNDCDSVTTALALAFGCVVGAGRITAAKRIEARRKVAVIARLRKSAYKDASERVLEMLQRAKDTNTGVPTNLFVRLGIWRAWDMMKDLLRMLWP